MEKVFQSTMFLGILPGISLVVLGILVMVFDLILPREKRRSLGWLVVGGLALIIILSLWFGRPQDEPQSLWGGMIRFDWLGFSLSLLFIFGAAITALFSMDVESLAGRGEFYLLLLASTLGMTLMASAGDLIMLYLAIETTSIPLYVLAGFIIKDNKSAESGFKYLMFGALTSTIMLYGFSLLYGFSGTTDLFSLAQQMQQGGVPVAVLVGSMLLVMVGFGFKVSAVPFHFWAPDVYEGSPTPVAGFLSTASKAAGFAVLLRFLMEVFPPSAAPFSWTGVVAVLAVVTMTLGNVLALAQRNIKRLLAYSSIAHAGYILVGVATLTQLGASSAVFYLIAYLLTNLVAFGVVVTFWRVTGTDEIGSYAGLSRRAPGLALVLLVAMLSLSGMPPFGGFVAKIFVFAAAVDANMVWLAVVGVLNSIIGLFYYLTVLKVVYLYRSDDEDHPLPITRPYAIAMVVLCFAIILVGTLFGPWFNWSSTAASAMF